LFTSECVDSKKRRQRMLDYIEKFNKRVPTIWKTERFLPLVTRPKMLRKEFRCFK
jgi:hypothetical protein